MVRLCLRVLLSFLALIPVFVFGVSGCEQRGLKGQIYQDAEARYRIGGVGHNWRQIELSENDVAFYNTDFAAAIQVNATCRKDYQDVSLDILFSHLLYGLTDRKVLKKKRMKLDRRAALYTEVSAKLDGVSVKGATVLIKKNYCIYDFNYMTRPWNFGRGLGDFHRVVFGFKVLPRK